MHSTHTPFYVLGGGSNLLITDKVIETPVLKLGSGFNFIKKKSEGLLEIGAGTPLTGVLNFCIKNNLQGLEVFAGMPATIGGMTVKNASSFGREFFSFIRKIEMIDKEGKKRILSKEEVGHGYRNTSLGGGVITKVSLVLRDGENIKKMLKKCIEERMKRQDINSPSAGCIFKNPKSKSAGFLIEQCGLKGATIGGASISSQHANFIVNRGGASAQDVIRLINLVKEKVHNKCGVLLEEEIERWAV
jgi:UDP-N-acetylmuramate dehydrogenase